MKNTILLVFAIVIALVFNQNKLFGQLPQNINKVFGWQKQGTVQGPGSSDWVYDVKSLPGGGYIATGYSELGLNKNPIVIKLDASGNIVWEQKYTCITGTGIDIYLINNKCYIIGAGNRNGSCGDPSSIFSIKVDFITGNLDQTYGVKLYNYQTLAFPLPQNGQTHTVIDPFQFGYSRSCEITSGGNSTGFMICGNFNDNSIPTGLMNVFVTTGCFLLKIDLEGRPDISFGNNGLSIYFQNIAGRYYNPHLRSVCVNYDINGNPQGYAVVGGINEQLGVAPTQGLIGFDALLFYIDLVGNITLTNVFDDSNHYKNTIAPFSILYTDQPDNLICANSTLPLYLLPQENNNEVAKCIKQVANGGDFIVVAQFDLAIFTYFTSCGFTYPTTGNFFIADPAVIRFDLAGTPLWSKNINESSGVDFENRLLIDQNNIFVLGCTMTDPPGAPVSEQALISKLDFAGTVLYERVYNETANSQTKYCPFSFDFDINTGGIVIGGDNDTNSDDYTFIGYTPR